ncbi:C40 family peptidase [Robertmurraya massiliosenegalensis]|uniref:C40 family peptidase n=1 Tax=Robertmurraya massiliosenegalensis TaxID=1287657 RepID=UPI0002F996E6|nr:NlpC/P60 family protein [Robertmurraya massiliosenegalensis]
MTFGEKFKINPVWLVALEMVLYENENLLDYELNDIVYHFLTITYEKYKPAESSCVEIDIDGYCLSFVQIPEEILERNTYKGKEQLKEFFKSHKESNSDIITAIANIDKKENVRLTVTTLSPEMAIEDLGLTEEEKEYYQDIIDSELIEEEYPQLANFYFGGIGGGAYCSPTKEIEKSHWDTAFVSAGKLSSYGQTIIDLSEKQGIDPVLFAAIAFHETGNGTSPAIMNKNNPGGLMGSSGLYEFSTLEEGLESMSRTLHNRIIKDGLTTIEQLGSKYAPVGAANDPSGLNNHWVPNVTKIVTQLGGLTMNCEAYANGLDIAFDGDVSEAAKIVASVGSKYIGRSEYVFGGGRNQFDILNGRFDCSSFVHWAYAQAGIDLGPLTGTSTETLNKMGRKVSISEIKVGDLIFWNTYKRDGHVGIYIGNGKWIGSQSSTGVAIENLSKKYYSDRFEGHVRRILPDA